MDYSSLKLVGAIALAVGIAVLVFRLARIFTPAARPFPLLPPERFFQPFAELKAGFGAAERKTMPTVDGLGYMTAPFANERFAAESWRKCDYGDPNTSDLSVSIIWHSSEADARSYYSRIVTKAHSCLPGAEASATFEMPGCSELAAKTISLAGHKSIVNVVVRYGNYMFNLTWLTTSDGYFPTIEAVSASAKAFDANVSHILSHA